MKTILVVLLYCLAGCFVPNFAFGQQLKGDYQVSAGLGIISTEQYSDITEDMGHILVTAVTLGYSNAGIINRTYSPTYHISFGRAISDRFYFGISGAYESATGDYQIDNEVVGNFQRKATTLVTAGKFLYLNRGNISLYGTAALGFTFNTQQTNRPIEWTEFVPVKNHFNGYASPIGVRVGRKLGGYLELGYGYKGMINTSLDYRF